MGTARRPSLEEAGATVKACVMRQRIQDGARVGGATVQMERLFANAKPTRFVQVNRRASPLLSYSNGRASRAISSVARRSVLPEASTGMDGTTSTAFGTQSSGTPSARA